MDLKNQSDNVLLKQMRTANRLAFNMLYEKYWDQLFQTSYKLLRDEYLAKDVVQEVFFDLWMRRKEHDIYNLAGYLYKATRFQSLKQLRKATIQDIHQEHFENVFAANETEERLDANELQQSLNNSLKKLPEKHQKIFEMSRNQNMTNREIAEKLQLSQRTVEWYLHTVLKHLKASIISVSAFITSLITSIL